MSDLTYHWWMAASSGLTLTGANQTWRAKGTAQGLLLQAFSNTLLGLLFASDFQRQSTQLTLSMVLTLVASLDFFIAGIIFFATFRQRSVSQSAAPASVV